MIKYLKPRFNSFFEQRLFKSYYYTIGLKNKLV